MRILKLGGTDFGCHYFYSCTLSYYIHDADFDDDNKVFDVCNITKCTATNDTCMNLK